MNRAIPTILIGVGSFLIGGSLGMKIMGDEYSKILENRYVRYLFDIDLIDKEVPDDLFNDEPIEEEVQISDRAHKAVHEIANNIIQTNGYADHTDGHEDPVDTTAPEGFEDGEEDISDEELSNDGPYIISVDSFQNDYETFSKNTLTYFEEDGVVADDRSEVIVDYADYIGADATDNFGEGSDDPNIVYVRNLKKEADYEVVRDPSSYSATVLGYEDPYDNARKFFNLDQDREE